MVILLMVTMCTFNTYNTVHEMTGWLVVQTGTIARYRRWCHL